MRQRDFYRMMKPIAEKLVALNEEVEALAQKEGLHFSEWQAEAIDDVVTGIQDARLAAAGE